MLPSLIAHAFSGRDLDMAGDPEQILGPEVACPGIRPGGRGCPLPEPSDAVSQQTVLLGRQGPAGREAGGNAAFKVPGNRVTVGHGDPSPLDQERQSVQGPLPGCSRPPQLPVGIPLRLPRLACPLPLGEPSRLVEHPKFGVPRGPTRLQHVKRAQQGVLVPAEATRFGLEQAQRRLKADRSVQLHARPQLRHPETVGQVGVANLPREVVEAHPERVGTSRRPPTALLR